LVRESFGEVASSNLCRIWNTFHQKTLVGQRDLLDQEVHQIYLFICFLGWILYVICCLTLKLYQAKQFSLLFRWEAAQIPKVKVAKLDRSKFSKEQSVYMPQIPNIAECPDHLLPLKQWEDAFLADFTELRLVFFFPCLKYT